MSNTKSFYLVTKINMSQNTHGVRHFYIYIEKLECSLARACVFTEPRPDTA